jgi:hypothetical protein
MNTKSIQDKSINGLLQSIDVDKGDDEYWCRAIWEFRDSCVEDRLLLR